MDKDLAAKQCCLVTGQRLYDKWLTDTSALHHPTMDLFIQWTVQTFMPKFAPLLNSGNVQIKSAYTTGDAWAQRLTEGCSCGVAVDLIILNSRLLFFVWRILTVASSLVEKVDMSKEGETKFSYHLPADKEFRQIDVTFQMYSEEVPLTDELLEELIATYSVSSPHFSSAGSLITSHAELWIALHEVAHLLPASLINESFVSQIVGLFNLREERARNWHEEIKADLNGCYMLVQGIVDRLLGEGIPPEDAADRALHLGFASATAAALVLEFLEFYKHGREEIIGLSFRNASEWRTHPPFNIRFEALKTYGSALPKRNGMTNIWGLAEPVWKLCNLLFYEYDKHKYGGLGHEHQPIEQLLARDPDRTDV